MILIRKYRGACAVSCESKRFLMRTLDAAHEAREMFTTFTSMMLYYTIVGRLIIEPVLLVCECRECDVG
jgi:hypothetical protein